MACVEGRCVFDSGTGQKRVGWVVRERVGEVDEEKGYVYFLAYLIRVQGKAKGMERSIVKSEIRVRVRVKDTRQPV